MSHDELQQIVGKARRFKELRRAKERVRQLERELYGGPVQPEDPPYVPEFLRVQVGSDSADRADPDVPCLRNKKGTHAMTATNSLGPNMPINEPPALPPRSRLIETSHTRSRHRVDLPEPLP